MKNVILAFFTLVVFVGCNSGGGGSFGGFGWTNPADGMPSETIVLQCADVNNVGNVTDCGAQQLNSFSFSLSPVNSAFAATIIDAGTLSRGQIIEATLSVLNDTSSDWQGYYSMVFDAGCNGESAWEIAPIQHTEIISASLTWTATVGGSCGDMPLGDRILTATVYDSDVITILDSVEVHFNLVE